MQFLQPKASFSLKCNDISLSDTFADYPVTNQVGTINAARTSMTWYSINLENILNSMYNEYDFFNLRIRYISYTSSAAFGVTANDRAIYYQMSGFNWANSNYDVTRGCNTNQTIIGANPYSEATSFVSTLEDLFTVTIIKQKTVDITITFLNSLFTTPAMNANTQFPRTSFYFDFTPVIVNPQTINLSLSKCSVLSTYYLAGTTTTNNIDMYQVLGRENFEIGAKYNLVFKFAQSATWAGSDPLIKGGMFNISSSGMRFQNYETAINKVGGTQMQMVTYGTFSGCTGAAAPFVRRNNNSGIMTFTLESQICCLTIIFQNLVNNTEYLTASSNTLIVFDIWKCF